MKKRSTKRVKKQFDKKRLIKFLIIFGILCLVVGLCLFFIIWFDGCDDSKFDENYEYDGSSLLGKWIDDDLEEKSYDVYNFIDEDTVILTTYCFGIEQDSKEASYLVEDGNKLKVSYEYKTSQTTGQTSIQNEYYRFSITDDNELVLIVLDDMNNAIEERVMIEYNLTFNASNADLVGDWVSVDNTSEHFIFDADYTGKITGATSEYKMKYSTNGSKLYIIYIDSYEFEYPVTASDYKVEGNTLTLSGEDGDGNTIEIKFERAE